MGALSGDSHGISYSCIKQPFRFFKIGKKTVAAIQLSVRCFPMTSCVGDCSKAGSGRILEPHSGVGIHASLSEVMALGSLLTLKRCPQHELARLLGLEKSTVSRLVAGLVDRGWVSRERNPDNRRLYRLQLTHDGQAAARQIGKELHARHTELLNGLTPGRTPRTDYRARRDRPTTQEPPLTAQKRATDTINRHNDESGK